MPTFSKDQYAAVIELSQVLWDGGMIAANRANIRAKADVDMAQQEINMYSLREKVNELYFGILSTSCTSASSTLTSRSVRWIS